MKNELKAYELHYQEGNIIQIRQEPERAKRYGFLLNSKHVIVKPPENRINTGLSVYVKDKRGIERQLAFPYWFWTGKTIQITLKKIKRKRTK
jgi:hypothetical protein